MNDLRSASREFVAAWVDAQKRMTTFLQQMQQLSKQVDLRELKRRVDSVPKYLARLAELGWTVPSWLIPAEVAELTKLDSDSLEEEFLRLYFEEGGLERTKDELTTSSHMKDWRPLLGQVFEALDRKDYLIAVPALLLMLEGFAAQFVESQFICGTNASTLVKKIKRIDDGGLTASVWASTVSFMDEAYKHANFSQQCPSFMNRHWILHGRLKATQWKPVDALRVLNALSTLHWLIEFEELKRSKRKPV